MKIKLSLLIFISIAFNACVNTNQKQTTIPSDNDSVAVLKTDSTEKIQSKEIQYSLALSAHAIQMINPENGSTKEIGFGMPLEQTLAIVEKILNAKPTVNINSECGAGVLKFATWDNGLTLIFEEKNKEWLFAGWAANKAKNPKAKLTTMSGIGIGSTRKEMENTYVIKAMKTSLGDEFSTKAEDLSGIFDGPNEDAKITNLWSGVSCNFR
ncbi:MAG: hypothetical protein ABIP95_07690 [Pelobium sp.]